MTHRVLVTWGSILFLRMAGLKVGLVVLLVAPLASADDPVTGADMTAYIKALTEGEAEFVQHNPDGSQSLGRLSFRRPWHGRIDYAAPNDAIILAAGQRVAVFDLRANTGPAIYPLRRTPFAMLLGADISLTDDKHYRASATGPEGSWIEIGLTESAQETMTLYFRHAPLALSGWIYRDAQGQETAVVLDRIREDTRFPPGYFSIEHQTERLFPTTRN